MYRRREIGLKPLLVFVALIALVELCWVLSPSNHDSHAMFAGFISVVALCLVPLAWRLNTHALAGLIAINLIVGAINFYRLGHPNKRADRFVFVLPLAIAISLWAIRRNALPGAEARTTEKVPDKRPHG
jgi:hypothetical protein